MRREFSAEDFRVMGRALDLARQAESESEIPVGAVIVDAAGKIAGEGWNRPVADCDPTGHAEIVAIRNAAREAENYRLPGATLYSTLEPCVMCAGAIVLARVDRLVFAARDLRFGAVRSKFALADSALLNHRVNVEEGLRAAEAGELIAEFFRRSRQKNSLHAQ